MVIRWLLDSREAAQRDKLVVAKLEVFIFIAGMRKPFLTKYQDKKPLVIYLGSDLAILMIRWSFL